MTTGRFDDADLTRRILAATSGAACGRAEGMLAARHEASLDPVDHALLDAHLVRCAPCRALAEALAWSLPALPALAERDPGSAFTVAVIARTSRRPATGLVAALERATVRLQDFAIGQARRCTGLMRRPRFALEAAWVGAALVAILVWSPIAPSGAADQAIAAAQTGGAAVPRLVKEAGAITAGLPGVIAPLAEPAGGLERELDAAVQGLRERASWLEARGHSLWRSLFGGKTTMQNENPGA